MENLLVGLIILLSACLVIAIFGLMLYIHRVTRAVQDIAEACTEIRRQTLLVGTDIRAALENLNELIRSAQQTVETAGRVASAVERLVDGRSIADAAEKVVSTSKSTLVVLGEAVKEAIKAFKSAGPSKAKSTTSLEESQQA